MSAKAIGLASAFNIRNQLSNNRSCPKNNRQIILKLKNIGQTVMKKNINSWSNLIILCCFLFSQISHAQNPVLIKVAAFNVEAGNKASAEEIAEVFTGFLPDILTLSEAPGGDWIDRLGKQLNLDHRYLGSLSSAHHKNKYKAILSRFPLTDKQEFTLDAPGKWNPASVVRAKINAHGIPLMIYSLHIAASKQKQGHLSQLINEVLMKDSSKNILLTGDFNHRLKDKPMRELENKGFRPVWLDFGLNVAAKTTVVSIEKRNRHGIIDHIFYRSGNPAKAVKGGIVEIDPHAPVSDHKPVWAVMYYQQTSEN